MGVSAYLWLSQVELLSLKPPLVSRYGHFKFNLTHDLPYLQIANLPISLNLTQRVARQCVIVWGRAIRQTKALDEAVQKWFATRLNNST